MYVKFTLKFYIFALPDFSIYFSLMSQNTCFSLNLTFPRQLGKCLGTCIICIVAPWYLKHPALAVKQAYIHTCMYEILFSAQSRYLLFSIGVQLWNICPHNTGWPRKNATLMINNFKKTKDRMKKLCALLRIKFFSHQDDTQIVNFVEGVLILWPFFCGNVIFKICPSISKVTIYVPKNFHCLASLGTLALY